MSRNFRTEHPEVVTKALFDCGALRFSVEKPFLFKSGILSPVYLDARLLFGSPESWRIVLVHYHRVLNKIQALRNGTILAGVELAGVPHAAVLAERTRSPVVVVRKEEKAHGRGRAVDGLETLRGIPAVVIEDVVTTGGSSAAAVKRLRDAGAVVEHVVALMSYDFPEALKAFAAADVALHPLLTARELFAAAADLGKLTEEGLKAAVSWLHNPHGYFRHP